MREMINLLFQYYEYEGIFNKNNVFPSISTLNYKNVSVQIITKKFGIDNIIKILLSNDNINWNELTQYVINKTGSEMITVNNIFAKYLTMELLIGSGEWEGKIIINMKV